MIYELADERDVPAQAHGEDHRLAWRLRARHRLHEPEMVVDRAGEAEIVALLRACRSARNQVDRTAVARAGLRAAVNWSGCGARMCIYWSTRVCAAGYRGRICLWCAGTS